LKFPALQDNPPMLLGRPMYENSNMNGTVNAAATKNNHPLLYGDFASGMVIANRLGRTLELVPHLFGAADAQPASAAHSSGSGPAATW
jgi:HK97 family phage major capsid protein